MVFGIQGPKSILSTSIANALAQFFVVDDKQIESSLLKDSNIVLNNVELRKQITRLPMNSAGTSTLITMTGFVKQVTFSWTWAIGKNKDEANLDAWVRDSKLTLKGLQFKVKLEYGTGQEELTILPPSPEETVSQSMDSDQAAQVTKQGGVQAWMTKQVEMIIDSLDLDVEDFQFTVDIPPPLVKPDTSSKLKEQTSIVMSGTKVQNISSGRQPVGTSSNSSSEMPPTDIQQQVSFGCFSIDVIETAPAGSNGSVGIKKVYPILEPFSYSADLTRSSGQRFSGFATGLTLIGKSDATSTDEISNYIVSSDLVIHFGSTQVEAITHLGIMLLPPPDNPETDARQGKESTDTTINEPHKNAGNNVDSQVDETGEKVVPPPVQEEDGSQLEQDQSTERTPAGSRVEGRDSSMNPHESDTSVNKGQPGTTLPDPSKIGDTSTIDNEDKCVDASQGSIKMNSKAHSYTPPHQNETIVSVFVIPMKSVTLVLEGNAKVVFPLLLVSYKGDSSAMDITASGCRMESISPEFADEKGPSFALSGIKLELYPKVSLLISEVTEIYVPNTIRLTKPIENPRICYEGKTLSIDLDTIEAEVPHVCDSGPQRDKKISKTANEGDDFSESQTSDIAPNIHASTALTDGKTSDSREIEQRVSVATSESIRSISGSVSDSSGTNMNVIPSEGFTESEEPNRHGTANEKSASRPMIPCPIIISVNEINVKDVARLNDLDVYANPNAKTNSNDVAVCLKEFDSKLLYVDTVNVFAALPINRPDEIWSLTFAAKSGRASAGYSTKDWATTFSKPDTKPVKTARTKSSSSNKPDTIKLPFASISALNLKVSWKGLGLSIKDTEVSVKPFKGDENTMAKDLIDYYVGAILSRVPGFISNADVLGFNIVDGAANTYGTWIGNEVFGTYLGWGGGLAAIAAVDGVKGAVRAGKTSRDAENGASYQPGDIIRGLIYSVGAATKTGAIRRGRDGKGNIADGATDFLTGVTIDTGEYVGENKSKLGAATVGGIGTVAGTLVAGPVGGIAVGLLASAVTRKAIDNAEEKANKKAQQGKGSRLFSRRRAFSHS